jgi:hypothetical protein
MMSRPDTDMILAQRRNIELFSRAPVVLELRHLTLGPYMVNAEGRIDHGFDCRTNAFIAAGSLSAMGCVTYIDHGKAVFVVGPSGSLGPIGLDVNPHSWVGIEHHGYFDISPTFRQSKEPRLKAVGEMLTVLGELRPRGRTFMARDESDYENLIALASHAQGEISAIYLGLEVDPMSSQLLRENVFEIYNSPLTDRLRKRYQPNILIKAIWHLVNFARGKEATLTTFTQDEAWRRLNKIPDAKVEWLFRRLAS